MRQPAASSLPQGQAPLRGRRRVVLYSPRVFDGYYRPPLGLLSLERMLDGSRYETVLLDGNLGPGAGKRLFDLAEGAVAVAVTVMPGRQTAVAYQDSLALKARRPDVPVIWGGYFPSMYPEASLRSRAADIVVRGLGEPAFPDLIDACAGGRRPDVASLPGAVRLDDGQLVSGPHVPPLDLNRLPPLRFDRLPMNRYLNHTWLGKRTMFTISSVGCPFNCGFCAIPAVNGQRWNTYSPQVVAGQIREWVERLGVDGIQFMDTEFFVNERRVCELAEGLAGLPSPVGWWAMGQVDRLVSYRAGTWQLLRESGCRGIFVGVESGSQAVLDLVGKKITVEQALDFAAITRQWGILPEFSFVLGFPPEPEKDVGASLDLMYDLKRVNPAAHLVPHVYTPLPRTGSADLAAANRFAAPESMDTWLSKKWQRFGRMRGAETPWISPALRRQLEGLDTVITFRNYLDADKSTARINRQARRLLRLLVDRRWTRRRFGHPMELVGAYRLGRLSVKVAERLKRSHPVPVRAGYARWAATYEVDLAGNPLAQADWRAVQRLLPDLRDKRVLDAACGTGRYARLAASAGARVSAIDCSAEMLGQARQLQGDIAWTQADVHCLPFPDGCFDLVLYALAAVHEPAVRLEELSRVLKPGGALILSDLHPYGQVQGWACTFAGGAIQTYVHTLADYREAFERAGLAIDAQETEAAPARSPAWLAGKPLAIAFRGRECRP
ncbi:MAG: methyltransferase domain-containing protein [Chloroflexota bacterium]|nr:methyltransferase domain-containing protein [Chloroflexota bacterium]